MMRSLKVFFILLVFLIIIPNVKAEDELNITRIKHNVEIKESELAGITKEFNELQSSINKKVSQLSDLRERAKHLETELENVAEELKVLEDRIADNEERKLELKNLSLVRVKALFFKKREATLRLLNFASKSDYLRDAFFLSKLDAYDKELLNRLADISTEQQQKKEELRKVLLNRDLLKSKLNLEERAISKSIDEETALRANLKQKKEQMEEALSKLRAEALHLEMVVKSLTGAAQTTTNKNKDIVSNYGTANLDQKKQGEGLLRGQLLRPIDAHVYRPYGTHIVRGFRELVTSKGVEFSDSTLGKAVYAVADGQVLYIGEMPAYGKVVIVSHGKRYYSLYGKLLNPSVSVQQEVSKGTEIGSADSGFYFEIRRQGQPVNPSTFYPNGLD